MRQYTIRKRTFDILTVPAILWMRVVGFFLFVRINDGWGEK